LLFFHGSISKDINPLEEICAQHLQILRGGGMGANEHNGKKWRSGFTKPQ